MTKRAAFILSLCFKVGQMAEKSAAQTYYVPWIIIYLNQIQVEKSVSLLSVPASAAQMFCLVESNITVTNK